MEELNQIYNSVLIGKAPETKDLVQKAVSGGLSVGSIISTMNSAMEEVGQRFSRNEIFLPEMMVAARAMKFGMEILEPLIVGEAKDTKGKVLIGTIKGDLHDIGKNLVAMMFRSAGFEVIDIGVDVTKERFLESIQAETPQLCAISALLTTVLANLAETIAFLKASEVGEKCKIIIGGAAVDAGFAERVGADGYSDDAGAAVQMAKSLVQSGISQI
jgi:5-methyltetrahydrofolate--homocysteine methyltransferase